MKNREDLKKELESDAVILRKYISNVYIVEDRKERTFAVGPNKTGRYCWMIRQYKDASPPVQNGVNHNE